MITTSTSVLASSSGGNSVDGVALIAAIILAFVAWLALAALVRVAVLVLTPFWAIAKPLAGLLLAAGLTVAVVIAGGGSDGAGSSRGQVDPLVPAGAPAPIGAPTSTPSTVEPVGEGWGSKVGFALVFLGVAFVAGMVAGSRLEHRTVRVQRRELALGRRRFTEEVQARQAFQLRCEELERELSYRGQPDAAPIDLVSGDRVPPAAGPEGPTSGPVTVPAPRSAAPSDEPRSGTGPGPRGPGPRRPKRRPARRTRKERRKGRTARPHPERPR